MLLSHRKIGEIQRKLFRGAGTNLVSISGGSSEPEGPESLTGKFDQLHTGGRLGKEYGAGGLEHARHQGLDNPHWHKLLALERASNLSELPTVSRFVPDNLERVNVDAMRFDVRTAIGNISDVLQDIVSSQFNRSSPYRKMMDEGQIRAFIRRIPRNANSIQEMVVSLGRVRTSRGIVLDFENDSGFWTEIPSVRVENLIADVPENERTQARRELTEHPGMRAWFVIIQELLRTYYMMERADQNSLDEMIEVEVRGEAVQRSLKEHLFGVRDQHGELVEIKNMEEVLLDKRILTEQSYQDVVLYKRFTDLSAAQYYHLVQEWKKLSSAEGSNIPFLIPGTEQTPTGNLVDDMLLQASQFVPGQKESRDDLKKSLKKTSDYLETLRKARLDYENAKREEYRAQFDLATYRRMGADDLRGNILEPATNRANKAVDNAKKAKNIYDSTAPQLVAFLDSDANATQFLDQLLIEIQGDTSFENFTRDVLNLEYEFPEPTGEGAVLLHPPEGQVGGLNIQQFKRAQVTLDKRYSWIEVYSKGAKIALVEPGMTAEALCHGISKYVTHVRALMRGERPSPLEIQHAAVLDFMERQQLFDTQQRLGSLTSEHALDMRTTPKWRHAARTVWQRVRPSELLGGNPEDEKGIYSVAVFSKVLMEDVGIDLKTGKNLKNGKELKYPILKRRGTRRGGIDAFDISAKSYQRVILEQAIDGLIEVDQLEQMAYRIQHGSERANSFMRHKKRNLLDFAAQCLRVASEIKMTETLHSLRHVDSEYDRDAAVRDIYTEIEGHRTELQHKLAGGDPASNIVSQDAFARKVVEGTIRSRTKRYATDTVWRDGIKGGGIVRGTKEKAKKAKEVTVKAGKNINEYGVKPGWAVVRGIAGVLSAPLRLPVNAVVALGESVLWGNRTVKEGPWYKRAWRYLTFSRGGSKFSERVNNTFRFNKVKRGGKGGLFGRIFGMKAAAAA